MSSPPSCTKAAAHERPRLDLARRLEAARPPPAVGVGRGTHPLDPVFARAGEVPLRPLPVAARAPRGAHRPRRARHLDPRGHPVRQDERGRTRHVLHHRQPPRPRPLARPDRRGRPRPGRVPPPQALRRVRPRPRPLPPRPAQEEDRHDPLRQRHDALGPRRAQPHQPPAALDPLAGRRRDVALAARSHGRGRGARHRLRVARQVPLHEPGRRGRRRHAAQVRDHRPARVDVRLPQVLPPPALPLGQR